MNEKIRRSIAVTEENAPDTIGSMLRFVLLDCRPEELEFTLECATEKWMGNVLGTLHGGISATVIDHAMGIVANALRSGPERGPTVELNLSYHKPLAAGKRVRVRVWILSQSRNLTRLRAEALDPEGTLCVSATGTYFFRG